ncbi:hypothetical protein E2C01_075564 [Portunus trituberculatus]|uniref:Uncharacterized protein n=1 Tax=Portunus trituberculatus TaxID=210409 RepID=A0A5B7IFD4_PORTR|nr:hypothetical protein [Portunus trituberculatus]
MDHREAHQRHAAKMKGRIIIELIFLTWRRREPGSRQHLGQGRQGRRGAPC